LLPDTFQIVFNDIAGLSFIDKDTACVVAEPVQAEAGVIWPENNFLELLRQRCNDTGALLIFDEVQTGFGRIGSIFATERFKVVPDIIVLAKALGGGMPLGAFISSKEIMSAFCSDPVLGHITTFGGHPVCCAAGLASLEVILSENLISNSKTKSELFRANLNHPAIKEVRGEGLLLAIKLSDNECVNYAVAHAPDYGLILDYFLFCSDSFRIAPPLTISQDEILWACCQLKKLLDDLLINVKKK
jgi:acetylornithine/N-succinyldiaminopimelate aminotransferase